MDRRLIDDKLVSLCRCVIKTSPEYDPHAASELYLTGFRSRTQSALDCNSTVPDND